jgi:hypothetical protein
MAEADQILEVVKSIWRVGRRPMITGNVHIDVARLPLSRKFLALFVVPDRSYVDPVELAYRALVRILEN